MHVFVLILNVSFHVQCTCILTVAILLLFPCQLRDGDSVDSPLIHRYCGQANLPSPVVTTSNHLWINFVSDSSVSLNGFRLEYATSGKLNSLFHSLLQCGLSIKRMKPIVVKQVHASHHAVINSRLSSSNCCLPSSHSFLSFPPTLPLPSPPFLFLSFPLSPFFLLFLFFFPFSTFLAPLSESPSTSYSSASSANTQAGPIFCWMSLSALVPGCGGILDGESGEVTSPQWPNAYPSDQLCQWMVITSPGSRIQVNMTDVDLPLHQQDCFTYVIVRSLFLFSLTLPSCHLL